MARLVMNTNAKAVIGYTGIPRIAEALEALAKVSSGKAHHRAGAASGGTCLV